MAQILVVDDDQLFLTLINKILTNNGHKISLAQNGDQALQMLAADSFDLMISDVEMRPVNGMELLLNSRSLYPDLEVIILTSHSTLEVATDAMKKGAFDYITKPLDVDALSLTVQHALAHCAVKAENRRLRAEMEHLNSLEGLVAQSGSMCNICNTIASAAPEDINLFLYGEDGTSKDRIARTLHRIGPRKDNPFQMVSCEQLSSQQMELDMFGYVRGAFDWADAPKEGLLETLCGGTLFLDDITFLSLDIQMQLLKALRNNKVCKIGGSEPTDVDVRIIAATSLDVDPLIKRGAFRADLYRELSALRIDIPPLRDRSEDILPLVDQILHEELVHQRGKMDLDVDAENILRHYRWPCNERELEGAVRYAAAVAKNRVITKESLPAQIAMAAERAIHSHEAPGATGQFKGQFFRTFLYDRMRDRLKKPTTDAGENKKPPPNRKNFGDSSDIKWLG
ncbi:MAG: sigma-54-dependent Fis family transcriptional regulator [Kiritimatiellales bacterium]|nr:sigma-54-dependent Fis family transcriptional regulator [Kiritimatiellota bacterium]MBL7011299.1 sigma-54-dependent Fis family transcriptional regulator [Kiritimatiellales bacterium]